VARRNSQITKRLSKMRGILPVEKDLLRRIGEIIDGGINNRGPTNPGINPRRRTIRNPKLPPPRNTSVQAGVGNATITWGAVNSPILNFYEVEIINTDTRLSQLKLAFSNKLIFGDNGTFKVRARCVARNGDASPYGDEVTFQIADDVLFLEGNKHESTLAQNLIIEDIYTPENYKVFCWGAFNLNSNFVPGDNPIPVMDFSRDTLYPIFSQLKMFPESENFVNQNADDFFESSQGAMFKPFPIEETAAFKDTENTFNVFVNDRNDAASLSMTLLSIPATITEVEEEFDFQDKSLFFDGSTNIQNSFVGSPFGWDPTGKITYIAWIKLPDPFVSPNVVRPLQVAFAAPEAGSILFQSGIADLIGSAAVLTHSSINPASSQFYRWFDTDIADFLQTQAGKWTVWILTYDLTIDEVDDDKRAKLRINNTNFGIADAHARGGGDITFQTTNLTSIAANTTGGAEATYFYHALWNTELSTAAIDAIVNTPQADLRTFFDSDYADPITSTPYALNLLHWWRYGVEELDIGQDFGNYTPLIDYNGDNLVDQTDLVADVPTKAGQA
jgi:hypothetical protein